MGKARSEYPEVDLSRLLERPAAAIMCRTPYEAQCFLVNAKEQFGQLANTWDEDGILVVWNVYDRRTGYTFYLPSDDDPQRVSYCNEEWFRNEGYQLIEFSDFLHIPELQEGDLPISFLMS